MNHALLSPLSDPCEYPARLPSPFNSVPHPLAVQAATVLQQRLENERDLLTCDGGKMFGVLVVRMPNGRAGFLSAFSGMIGGQWDAPGFVPPLCDRSILDSSRPEGSELLAELTRQIDALEQGSRGAELTQLLASLEQQRHQAITAMKAQHRKAKEQRRQTRQQLRQQAEPAALEPALAALAHASMCEDRELRRLRLRWREKLQHTQQQLAEHEQAVQQIRERRAECSRQLHKRFFAAYALQNVLGETRALTDCFPEGLPPAGSGDCAAPKLIHYAVLHRLQPLALAEFWWGESPAGGIRHHGHFYPACRGKCRPILPFMLRGLEVEPEPDYIEYIAADEPVVVWEDEHLLLVNKPAGLMSVPGKVCEDSVSARLQRRYPDCPDLKLVHRLDMDTSGLLLVAKNLRIHAVLQQQFIQRTVEKRYEALLDGLLPSMPEEGEIRLPLRVDLEDRPRQMVCYRHGKPALTHWQCMTREGGMTRVCFTPHTGRTHQLRVHAAHPDGLDLPIVGDVLYGRPAERMMLHARQLSFSHPMSHQSVVVEVPTPF